MKDTGNKLKNARLSQNISLEEVAQATKIKVQTIIALEEGDLDKLPKKAFIRGFVRTYGSFLKLDTNELLDSFHKEMGSTQKQTLLQSNDTLSDDPAVQIANSKRNPFTRGVMAGAIAIILIVIYMTSRVIQKYQDEKMIAEETIQVEPITATPAPITVADASATPSDGALANAIPTATPTGSPTPSDTTATLATVTTPTPTPTVSATATIKPSPTPSATPSPTPKPSVSPTATVQPSPSPSPTVKPSPTATATPKPSPTPTAKPSPSPSPSPSATPVLSLRPQEVIVEALDRVEIQFSTDGEKQVRIKLEPEQVYTIKAKNSIQFRASDGGAINLIYNGRDQGAPGTLGERFETKFPR